MQLQLPRFFLILHCSLSSFLVPIFCTHTEDKTKILIILSFGFLQIWHETSIPGGLISWMLNATFRLNIKMALSGKPEKRPYLDT